MSAAVSPRFPRYKAAPAHPESLANTNWKRLSKAPASRAVLPRRECPATATVFWSISGQAVRYSRTTLAPQAHKASFPGAVGWLLSTWNKPPALAVKSPLSGEMSPQWKEATASPRSHSSSEGRYGSGTADVKLINTTPGTGWPALGQTRWNGNENPFPWKVTQASTMEWTAFPAKASSSLWTTWNAKVSGWGGGQPYSFSSSRRSTSSRVQAEKRGRVSGILIAEQLLWVGAALAGPAPVMAPL